MSAEWRQFRILFRTSLDRFIEAAVASRGIDATHFVIWSFALVVTPPFFFAVRMMSKYAFMWRQPEMLERVALADRLFFVVYSMLAAALLAAILWDALFPDRQDQEIIGVLPVRPRTLAAARLTAAVAIGTTFSAALALPSGFAYMADVGAGFRSQAILGWPPAVFVTHIVTLTVTGVFTFASLLALRGLAVALVGAEAAQRAALLLQLVTMVLLLESLFFLPKVLSDLSRELNLRTASTTWIPPLWFMGLYASLAGPPIARVPGLAFTAVAATVAAVAAAAAAYLLPAAWNARRTLETRLKTRAWRIVVVARWLASPWLRQPAGRAVFDFTIASLVRSRRHALTLASYLGIAVALCAVRFAAAHVRDRALALDVPADYLLALPLVMTFFLVAALRAAFAVPTDLEGNWIFRVARPRSTAVCVHALGVTVVMTAVMPVTLAWLVCTLSLWRWDQAVAAALMHAASGVALVEWTLVGSPFIPFTRAHAASVRTVRGDWILGLLALHLFAFRLDDLQLLALRSPKGVLIYLAAMSIAVVGARLYRRSRRVTLSLEFDAPSPDAPASLNLSQALG